MFGNPKYTYNQFDGHQFVPTCNTLTPYSNDYNKYLINDPKYPNKDSHDWLEETCNNALVVEDDDTPIWQCKWDDASADSGACINPMTAPYNKNIYPDFMEKKHKYTINGSGKITADATLKYPNVDGEQHKIINSANTRTGGQGPPQLMATMVDTQGQKGGYEYVGGMTAAQAAALNRGRASNNIIEFCGGRNPVVNCSDSVEGYGVDKQFIKCNRSMEMNSASDSLDVTFSPCTWRGGSAANGGSCGKETNLCLNTKNYFDLLNSSDLSAIDIGNINDEIKCGYGPYLPTCASSYDKAMNIVETNNITPIGKPDVFEKTLDKGYNNPKLQKYFDIKFTGYYNKAPLSIPTIKQSVDPTAAAATATSSDNIYDDGVRYYDPVNGLNNTSSFLTGNNCSNNNDCPDGEFCNNANVCSSCIDAIDYRDFTRDTIGIHQFNKDNSNNKLWDGQLTDIRPPLCKDNSTEEHCICIDDDSKNQIPCAPSDTPSNIISASECDGTANLKNINTKDPVADDPIAKLPWCQGVKLSTSTCRGTDPGWTGTCDQGVQKIIEGCKNSGSTPNATCTLAAGIAKGNDIYTRGGYVQRNDGSHAQCFTNKTKGIQKNLCKPSGMCKVPGYKPTDKIISSCTFIPGHEQPDKEFNIVKSVFSRYGLRDGILKCNASWTDRFQEIHDELTKFPPHTSYVSKLDRKISIDSIDESIPSWYTSLGNDDDNCLLVGNDSNTEAKYNIYDLAGGLQNASRCWVGDMPTMNYTPENVITKSYSASGTAGMNLQDLSITGIDDKCNDCRGLTGSRDPNIGTYIDAYNCEMTGGSSNYWIPHNYKEISKTPGTDAIYKCNTTCERGLVRLGSASGTDNKLLWSKYCSGFMHSMTLPGKD
jgi:hypothetical protein